MMRKPAAAKAKASSVARSPRSAARSPAPVAKRMRSKQASDSAPELEADAHRTFEAVAIRKQLEDALARAAAAEAREGVAKEQARQARDDCREATNLAQQRSERAASAEGQLMMLREVYDQMHEAYAGSMAIIKSVAAALPREGGTSDQSQSQLMLEAPNENSAENSTQAPGTPRIRSLSPSPVRAEPMPIASADHSIMSSLLSNAVRTASAANSSSARDSTEGDSSQSAAGRRSGIDQTPNPTTPLREPKPTPEKTRGYSERLPQTPMNFARGVPQTPTSLARGPSREQMLLNDRSANVSSEFDAAGVEKSDPKKVLSTLPWPKTINEWGQLQSKVWAGHTSLPKEWLRIWSQSHDAVYYLNLSNRKTTFDIKEVK